MIMIRRQVRFQGAFIIWGEEIQGPNSEMVGTPYCFISKCNTGPVALMEMQMGSPAYPGTMRWLLCILLKHIAFQETKSKLNRNKTLYLAKCQNGLGQERDHHGRMLRGADENCYLIGHNWTAWPTRMNLSGDVGRTKELTMYSVSSYASPGNWHLRFCDSCMTAPLLATWGDTHSSKGSKRFHWFGLCDDVENHIRACAACARTNNPSRLPRAPLTSVKAGHPLQKVAIDIIGPLPRSSSGHEWSLVVSDYFTKFVQAYPREEHNISKFY